MMLYANNEPIATCEERKPNVKDITNDNLDRLICINTELADILRNISGPDRDDTSERGPEINSLMTMILKENEYIGRIGVQVKMLREVLGFY